MEGVDQVVLFMAADGQSVENNQEAMRHSNTDNSLDRRLNRHQSSNLLRKRTTVHSFSFSKPKARNVEPNLPSKTIVMGSTIDQAIMEEPDTDYLSTSTDWSSSSDEEDEEQDETHKHQRRRRKKRKINLRRVIEWSLFLTILTCLILSLSISSLRNNLTWGLLTWKWCLMVMVIFSGRLCSGWVVGFLVFLIERNFMLREKVLYFVYGLRKSIQNCVWLGLVLLAWTCMFNAQVPKKNKVVKKVFQLLVAILLGATIWLVKIILVKTLASSFHVRTYFDRMKESVFHHYILDTLSGIPMDKTQTEEDKPLKGSKSMPVNWKEARKQSRSKKYGTRKVDMEKLKKLSMESSTSAWSAKRLMKYIRSSGLSTISKTVDEFGKAESEITSEWEARTTAKRIFKNVAKHGARYIAEEDLARFLKRDEIHAILPLFEGALETGRITKSSFRNWVVRAYFERKALAHSLNDTKTAVQQLHKLASAIVSVIIFVMVLLVTELATPKVVAVFITQLLVLSFVFHNTCKTIFECIIFVFVMHPFDIGDRCKIDGIHMIVEEMNILTTVFLRYDNEKIYYPNSVLLSKPISNFYRSPEMCDAIDFTMDISTPIETINAFKKTLQSYIDSKPNHWNSTHSIIVKDIVDLNKMKMALCVTHTINHQNYGERNIRITELILEMKRIFETLGIKYHLLPQEIHLTQFNINGLPMAQPS